jgi:hypothetical protein
MVSAQNPRTSFIPKQQLADAKRRKGGTSFLVLIGGVVVVVSIILAGLAYAYERVLISNIDNARKALEHNRSTLSTKDIVEWQRLDNRVDTLKNLLSSHLAFSEFFGVLGLNTLEQVRFTRFSYELDNDGTPHITLSGEAPDYATVVAQSDVFGRVESFQEPIFGDLALDISGRVSFSVTLKVDADLVSYREAIF